MFTITSCYSCLIQDPNTIDYCTCHGQCKTARATITSSGVVIHDAFLLATRATSLLSDLRRRVAGTAVRSNTAVVDAKLSTIDIASLESLQGLLGARNVDKVGMCKASGLPCATIDGHTDIEHIAHLAEQLVKVGIRHLKGQVADKERLAGRVSQGRSGTIGLVTHDHPATMQDGHVLGGNGFRSLLLVLKGEVAETAESLAPASISSRHAPHTLCSCLVHR